MNGGALDGLNQLKRVYLENNTCVNEYFISPNMIALLPELLDSKCGFDESATDLLVDFVCIAVLLIVAISCFFHSRYCPIQTPRPAPVIAIRVIAQ
jgi:hypothetical protein